MNAEFWVSVDPIAAHLGVVKDSVYRSIETTGMLARKMGRLWQFEVSEVGAWVRTGGCGSAGQRRPQRTQQQRLIWPGAT